MAYKSAEKGSLSDTDPIFHGWLDDGPHQHGFLQLPRPTAAIKLHLQVLKSEMSNDEYKKSPL